VCGERSLTTRKGQSREEHLHQQRDRLRGDPKSENGRKAHDGLEYRSW
jgi:hypothetical protein